jgi:hypothetical protein
VSFLVSAWELLFRPLRGEICFPVNSQGNAVGLILTLLRGNSVGGLFYCVLEILVIRQSHSPRSIYP